MREPRDRPWRPRRRRSRSPPALALVLPPNPRRQPPPRPPAPAEDARPEIHGRPHAPPRPGRFPARRRRQPPEHRGLELGRLDFRGRSALGGTGRAGHDAPQPLARLLRREPRRLVDRLALDHQTVPEPAAGRTVPGRSHARTAFPSAATGLPTPDAGRSRSARPGASPPGRAPPAPLTTPARSVTVPAATRAIRCCPISSRGFGSTSHPARSVSASRYARVRRLAGSAEPAPGRPAGSSRARSSRRRGAGRTSSASRAGRCSGSGPVARSQRAAKM